jgi:hypothetical protein
MDLQALQIARKHTPLGIVQSGQVFGTRLSEDAGCEIDEVATHVHGTNGGIAIEVEFFYCQMRHQIRTYECLDG